MLSKAPTRSGDGSIINKYALNVHWPRLWIIILGIILLFLCFCIAGMEVGHTLFDLRRSTAFGGFILFIPLLICSIFVFVTACKPSLLLLRIAVVLCIIMIILLMVLIAYDILVLIDPTRCFFLNCNDALVYQWNSTTNGSVSGWPLYISWPSYFQTNMNAKRIFQAIQLLCASLFILFAALYLLTFFIYRYIRLEQQQVLTNLERQRPESHGVSQTKYVARHPSPAYSNRSSYSNRKVTVYMIDAHLQPETVYKLPPPPATVTTGTRPMMTSTLTPKPARRPRASSVTYERLCTRCYKEPRLILRTPYERENFFGHLCVNCNNDLIHSRPRPAAPTNNKSPRAWKP